jgi:hypothetical protein
MVGLIMPTTPRQLENAMMTAPRLFVARMERAPVDLVHRDDARTVVTTGLDPVVHPLRIKFLRRRWIAGS